MDPDHQLQPHSNNDNTTNRHNNNNNNSKHQRDTTLTNNADQANVAVSVHGVHRRHRQHRRDRERITIIIIVTIAWFGLYLGISVLIVVRVCMSNIGVWHCGRVSVKDGVVDGGMLLCVSLVCVLSSGVVAIHGDTETWVSLYRCRSSVVFALAGICDMVILVAAVH